MNLTDRVYGKIKITEPVILDIIGSPVFQRLRGIDQIGYMEPFYKGVSHSRFEHSIGVYWLLHIYGAPLEEQIAGLIHDVSHLAFSHCADYALDTGAHHKQDLQDRLHHQFVGGSEIPSILIKYGFKPEEVLNDKRHPLKENTLPDICADRIDYSLRTARVFKNATQKEIIEILSRLKAKNNRWFFDDFKTARSFAELFMKLNREHYASLRSAVMFRTVGDTLRHAIQKKYISEKDLYKQDTDVIRKIKKHLKTDAVLKLKWDRMHNKIPFIDDPKKEGERLVCKSRVIDPMFQDHNQLRRVSEKDAAFAKKLKAELKPKQYFIKFEK